jgi:predicted PurR-regulated permease PerM
MPRRRAPLPHPIDLAAWSPVARALGWLTLAAIAFLAIGAAAGALASLLAARGGLLLAIFAGWLIAAVAERPIDAMEARGWSRHRAALLVYLAGGLPLLLLLIELAINLAAPLAALVEAPTAGEIARWASGPERLLRAVGLHFETDPLIADLIAAVRAQAAIAAGSAASIAAGALSAVGPILIAIASGFLLSTSRPAIVSRLSRYAPARGRGAFGIAERSIAGAFAAFITGQVLIGLAFGVAAFVAGAIGGADGLLTGVVAGLAMAIPAIGPVIAPVAVALILLVANGTHIGIAMAVTAVAWFIVANVLSPRLLTSGLRVPGWSVLVAAIVGDQLAGIAGSIVALPVIAAIIAIEDAWARR